MLLDTHIPRPGWLRGYLNRFPAIDPWRVGPALGQGNEYIALRYMQPNSLTIPSGYVLKVPQIERKDPKHWLDPHQLYREYKTLQTIFGQDTVLETHIVTSAIAGDPSVCLMQKEVAGATPLTKELLKESEELREQFAEILYQNHIMHTATGRYLPFLGREGGIGVLEGKPRLANLMVDGKSEKIYIGDLGRLTESATAHLAEIEETQKDYPQGNESEAHRLFARWLLNPAEAVFEAVRDAFSINANDLVLRAQFSELVKAYVN